MLRQKFTIPGREAGTYPLRAKLEGLFNGYDLELHYTSGPVAVIQEEKAKHFFDEGEDVTGYSVGAYKKDELVFYFEVKELKTEQLEVIVAQDEHFAFVKERLTSFYGR